MALTYETASEKYLTVLDNINLFFTSVFILELILKITALGFHGYFSYGWNCFDATVVAISILDLIMDIMG